MKSILFLTILFVNGCSINPYSGMSDYEKMWQTTHLIDVAQTYKIAKDPCYIETGFLTKDLIGSNPSTGKVIAWGSGLSLSHAYASKWLDDRDWPQWIKNTIKVVDIGYKFDVITGNYNLGIRLGRKNRRDRCNVF